MAAVTLQGTIEKSKELKLLVADQVDEKLMRQKAREIYRDAIEIVAAELGKQPLIGREQTVYPVVVNLHEILKDPGYHGWIGLQRSFTKIFRVFVELGWYQSWRLGIQNQREEIRVDETFRNELINISRLVKTILKGREDTTTARFELRCAEEAVKRLTPSTPLWQRYTLLVIEFVPAIADRSAGAIWAAMKPLIEQIHQDLPTGWLWYHQVHVLRWESTLVRTPQDFKDKIAPKIALCKEEGDNHSLCLAIVLIELIRNPNVDRETKRMAFSGIRTNAGRVEQEGLVHLINWEHQNNGLKSYIKHPSEITHEILRQADRFWETREVTLRFFRKLATQEKYSDYKADSLAAIKARGTQVAERKSRAYADEKRKIKVSLAEIEEKRKNVRGQLIDIGKQCLALDASRSATGAYDEGFQRIENNALKERESLLEENFYDLSKQIEQKEGDLAQLDASFEMSMDGYEADFISKLFKA